MSNEIYFDGEVQFEDVDELSDKEAEVLNDAYPHGWELVSAFRAGSETGCRDGDALEALVIDRGYGDGEYSLYGNNLPILSLPDQYAEDRKEAIAFLIDGGGA